MTSRLVFFTSDRGFLLPTIAAARQIVLQERLRDIVDVLVFLVDFSDDETCELRQAFADTGIYFENVSSAEFLPPAGSVFHQTHVPPSTLARLVVADRIPEQYEHIVYLDGDIRIVGDISPLLSHNVQDGRILSACDAMWLYEGDHGRYWHRSKAYLTGIGISNPRDYFNAGVLAFRRRTWIEIAKDAKDFFFTNSQKCRYHDQSALNAVCRGRREVLSPAFNFINNYAELGRLGKQSYRILHFTGAAKPWFYAGPPWNGQFLQYYHDAIVESPILSRFTSDQPSSKLLEIDREVRVRRRKAALTPWVNLRRRRRFDEYCQETQFAL